jgi:hypothetical protein
VTAVATVATDGGENKLSLEPIRLQVIRVADSLGEVYFEDFVAQSLKPEEILRFFFQSNPRLQRFLAYLQLDWSELMPGSDFQRSQLLSMLRELMEWAALMKLASQPPLKLLIRDGLLRSVLLTDAVFQRLHARFVKYLMSQLYSSPPDVGLLIFDPEGEYALPDAHGRPGLVITGILMRRIFQHNLRHLTEMAGRTVRCLTVLEEAQTMLGDRTLDDRDVFVRWVKEGRKYGLGCILVTQHDLLRAESARAQQAQEGQ